MQHDDGSEVNSTAGKAEDGKKKKESKHKQAEVCEIQTREIVCTVIHGMPDP